MFPFSFEIIIDVVMFLVGVLAGVEFIRAGQRIAQSHAAAMPETLSQKRAWSPVLLGIMVMIILIILSRVPISFDPGIAFAAGIILAFIIYGVVKSVQKSQ